MEICRRPNSGHDHGLYDTKEQLPKEPSYLCGSRLQQATRCSPFYSGDYPYTDGFVRQWGSGGGGIQLGVVMNLLVFPTEVFAMIVFAEENLRSANRNKQILINSLINN